MLRIVITGAESSGKTTLARQLAAHFDLPYVAEYARWYLENKPSPAYQQKDLAMIAQKQIANERALAQELWLSKPEKPFLICDTDLLTIKIWEQEVFKTVQPELLKWIDNQNNRADAALWLTASGSLINIPSLYLLVSPEGIAWEPDPLRENPQDRDRLFQVYEAALIFYQKNYQILRGGQKARLAAAIEAIKGFVDF
jgi:nicotinamide riboside kinase